MRRLSGILERAQKKGWPTPAACCRSLDGNSILTFRAAYEAQLQHQKWLNDHVLLLLLLLQKNKKNRGTTTTHHRKEERVLIVYLSSNYVDLFLSVLACSAATTHPHPLLLLPTLLNTRWTTAEMVAVLRGLVSEEGNREVDCDVPLVILYSAEFEIAARTVASCLPQHCQHCLPIPSFATKKWIATHSPPNNRQHASPPGVLVDDATLRDEIQYLSQQYPKDSLIHDDAILLFTSGTTTGGSKGVRLSHRALLVQALSKLLPPCHLSSTSVVMATTVPFYHVGGLTNCLAVWMAGGCLAITTQSSSSSSFDPKQVLQALALEDAINTLVVVPAMLHALEIEISKRHDNNNADAAAAAAADTDTVCTFPKMDLLLVGGQSASHTLVSFARRVFPRARLVQTYACTEAASSLTFLDVTKRGVNDDRASTRQPPQTKISGDCVGYPPDHVQLALVPQPSSDHGAPETLLNVKAAIEVPYTVGLIATRGPHLMNGYWGGTSWSNYDQKWWISNDLGYWDEQKRLWFCGRHTDSIRTGGETVLAAEVERVLLQHPRIYECAVFGLPDEKFGHVVSCAVVLQQATTTTIGELRHWCEQQGLAGYKRPRRVFQVKEIPKNSSGKTLKYRLVELFRGSDNRSPTSRL